MMGDDSALTVVGLATLLNTSPKYADTLLDEGKLPFHTDGIDRFVKRVDALAFKRVRDTDRAAALDALAQQTQDFGGYTELPGE